MFNPDFERHELIPVVVQDSTTKRVVMLAFMNSTAFKLTLDTGLAHFWSRSRSEIWKKGETSGNTLRVSAIEMDCDSDSLLLQVEPAGPSCHNGTTSCFDSFELLIDREEIE
jgi:phosphoribosyl-AMP cyclohydrolase